MRFDNAGVLGQGRNGSECFDGFLEWLEVVGHDEGEKRGWYGERESVRQNYETQIKTPGAASKPFRHQNQYS